MSDETSQDPDGPDGSGPVGRGPDDRRRRALERNVWLLDVARSLRMALVVIPVIVLYWKEAADIDVGGVFALQVVFSVTVILFEVPSGYVSDRLGRKRTLVGGGVLVTAGFVLYALSSSLGELVVAEVVLGIGLAIWSGTDSALLYETLAELGRTGGALRRESRSLFLRQATESGASIVGGYLAAWVSLTATVWATVVPQALAAIACLGLTEPRRKSGTGEGAGDGAGDGDAERSGHAENLRVVRADLRRIGVWYPLIVGALLSSGTLVGVWLHQLLWDRAGMATVHFGLAWAALNLAVALSALVSSRLHDRLGLPATLAVLAAWEFAMFGVLGWWISPWVFLAGCSLNVVRGVGTPMVVTALNDQVADDRRATILSIQSFASRGTFTVLAPLIGWIGATHGLSWAATVAGGVCGGLALVVAIAFGRQWARARAREGKREAEAS